MNGSAIYWVMYDALNFMMLSLVSILKSNLGLVFDFRGAVTLDKKEGIRVKSGLKR